MAVFPGFSYYELQNMDVRDREFWEREARQRELVNMLTMVRAVALGGGSMKDGPTQLKQLREELENVHKDMEEFYDNQWGKR